MQDHHIRIVIACLALAAALAAPFAVGPFWMTLLTQILIFGLLALAVDLLLGHAGPVLGLPCLVLCGLRLHRRHPAGALRPADHCCRTGRNPRRHAACRPLRRPPCARVGCISS